MRLEGKVALISGGSRGQGAAEARLFAREGAAVVIGDILDEEGLKLEAEIRELGGRATYVHLDVTEPEQWESAVARAVSEHGKLDILVNNAGIGSAQTGGLNAPKIDGTSTELWDRILNVNGKGVFLGTKAAIPAMRSAGGGSIINISSIAGMVGLAPAQRSGSGVRGLQGLGEAAHQVHGRAIWSRGHKMQFGPSGFHRDGYDRTTSIGAGGSRRGGCRNTDSADWHGGRHCQRGVVPGIRRVVIHDRQRDGHRRRLDRPIGPGIPWALDFFTEQGGLECDWQGR